MLQFSSIKSYPWSRHRQTICCAMPQSLLVGTSRCDVPARIREGGTDWNGRGDFTRECKSTRDVTYQRSRCAPPMPPHGRGADGAARRPYLSGPTLCCFKSRWFPGADSITLAAGNMKSVLLLLLLLSVGLSFVRFTSTASASDAPMLGFTPEGAAQERKLEGQFDAALKREDLRDWMRRM